MSLRSRLALLFGLLALAVSAAVGVFALQSTRAEFRSSTDEFLAARATEVAAGTRVAPEGRRPPGQRGNSNSSNDGGATDGRGGLPFDPDSIVQSLNAQGEVSGTSGSDLPITAATKRLVELRPRAGTRVGEYDNITVDGLEHRMYSRALPNGGVIQVARSTAENDAVLSGLTWRFAIIALIASAAASVAGWWVARRTTKPLRELADVAATVADTRDFSTRVSVERTDEIGNLAGSFQEMLTALENSRAQQHRLVHDAGHELRTPLTSLRANIELLERAEQSTSNMSDHDRQELIGSIGSELSELGNLFGELMELATDSRDADDPFAPVDLSDVVDRSVERWERRSERDLSVHATSTVVNGNDAMLERALTNLLGNAHKFSPPGTPIEVHVGNGAVTVRDSGPGIAPEDRERVFDRFYRSDLTRTMPGSGLGLAIVAQIVERHGGLVWAGESPTGGAEVGFRLPVV